MIYAQRATVWRRGGDGFVRDVLPCVWQGAKGATPGSAGDSSARQALVLLPPDAVPPKRGDYAAEGVLEGDKPVPDAYAVTTAEPLHVRGTLNHWEVSAT